MWDALVDDFWPADTRCSPKKLTKHTAIDQGKQQLRYLIKLHKLELQTQTLLPVLPLQPLSNKWWTKMDSGCSGTLVIKKKNMLLECE